MSIVIFEDDACHPDEITTTQLDREYVDAYLDGINDIKCFDVEIAFEDDSLIIFTADDVDAGDSYKFIGTK